MSEECVCEWENDVEERCSSMWRNVAERRNVYRREIFQEVEKEVTIRKHVILYSPQIEKVQFFLKTLKQISTFS